MTKDCPMVGERAFLPHLFGLRRIFHHGEPRGVPPCHPMHGGAGPWGWGFLPCPISPGCGARRWLKAEAVACPRVLGTAVGVTRLGPEGAVTTCCWGGTPGGFPAGNSALSWPCQGRAVIFHPAWRRGNTPRHGKSLEGKKEEKETLGQGSLAGSQGEERLQVHPLYTAQDPKPFNPMLITICLLPRAVWSPSLEECNASRGKSFCAKSGGRNWKRDNRGG